MYKILKNKYPGILSREITAKDVIFICRDAFKSEVDAALENELLNLVQQKDWAWYARDIDNNIILTYPIFNGSKKIVDYLIKSKKYDISEYNPTLSNALGACISLKGEEILDYLLDNNLNFKYKNELITKALVMASKVKEEKYFDKYIRYADKMISDCDFIEVAKSIIYPSNPDVFNYFLFNHPLNNEEKVVFAKNMLEEYSVFNLSNNDLNNKNKLIEKFEMLTELQKMPTQKNIKKVSKI